MYTTCVFLAHKFHEELDFWNLEEFSNMSSCDPILLEKSEMQLIKALNFKLHVSQDKYETLVSALCRGEHSSESQY